MTTKSGRSCAFLVAICPAVTKNIYRVINAVYDSNLESVNPAKRFHTNSQQKCIDCLKPKSNKNERECKKSSSD